MYFKAVLELLEGFDLADLLKEHSRLSVSRTLDLLEDIGSVFDALEKACSGEKLKPRRMDRLSFTEVIWNQTVMEIEAARVANQTIEDY